MTVTPYPTVPVWRKLRPLALLLLAGALAACSNSGPEWNSKAIDGLMPDLSFELINTRGETVTASDYDGQVRLMFFGFTSCPDVCPDTLARLNKAIGALPEQQQDDVTILFISVDPERDTPEKIASYTKFFGDRIVGLTAKEATLRDLAKDYRTTFGYGEPDDSGNYLVSHSSAVYVFDRDGNARLLIRPELSADQITSDLHELTHQES